MTKNLLRGLGVGWLVLAAASCLGTEDPTTEDTDSGVDRSGQDIQQALDALPSAQVVDVDESGVPTFVAGALGRAPQAVAGGAPDARQLVAPIAKIFRANPDELALKHGSTDESGIQHFRYTQLKNGLEVIGGEIIVHVRDGAVIAANGSARADLKAPKSPTIDEAAAVEAAKSASAKISDLAASIKETQSLAYHLAGGQMKLVYLVEVTGVDEKGTPVRDDVLVNATDGSIVNRIPHIHTALNREIHNLNHGTNLPGATARIEGGAAVSDAIVNNNYTLLGDVYNGYKTLFNRDSFDNAGAKLISSVHYDNNYVNAYWDGVQMVYGDGDGVNASNLANSLDVTAHELTHAVTERTSNLVYSGESGGLNESFSDVLGNCIEWFKDGQPNPPNDRNFLVGDDVWTPSTPGDALRYMADPAKDGASLDFYSSTAGNKDVHYSSGIQNLAFALLAKGGKHPRGKSTIDVTGIGMLKACQVFYKSDTAILKSTAKFADAKTASEQAATQLGFSAAEVASVTAAWQAVGVGAATPPPSGGGKLSNGVPVTASGAQNSQTFYSLDVPAGATNLKFATSGGTGDVDLFVKFGSQPTTTSYDCRPFKNGNAESCAITTAKTGTYHVMLVGFASYANVSLVGSFTGGSTPPPSTCNICTASTGPLSSSCDPCASQVCTVDSYCCTTAWDSQCVGEVSSVCGKTCQ